MKEKFSKKYLKNLPTGVFITRNEEDYLYLIYKLPLKLRKSNISLSFKENHHTHALLTAPEAETMMKLKHMPHHYLEIIITIQVSNDSYEIKYGLFFNPYLQEDMDIIKKLISKKVYYFFYDKNSILIGLDRGGMDWGHRALLNIEEYPEKLRDINMPMIFRRRYDSDVVIYYYKEWDSVPRRYRISQQFEVEYVYSDEDLQTAVKNVWFSLPILMNQLFDKTKTMIAINYFLTKINKSDLTPEGALLVEHFAQFFKIIADYLDHDLPAQFLIEFESALSELIRLLEDNHVLWETFFTNTRLFILSEMTDIQEKGDENIKDGAVYFSELIRYIWLTTYLQFCVRLKKNQYFYVDNEGRIDYFSIPTHLFTSIRRLQNFLEGLSAQLFWVVGVNGVNKLLDNNDDFEFSLIYQKLPIIENAEDIFPDMIQSALKFREYFIAEPSEVLINNKIFKSFVFYDVDNRYCACKIITSDNKVSYALINKLNPSVDWSWWDQFSPEQLCTIAALCCAVYRDFCVSETRLYEKKKAVEQRRAKPKGEVSTRKVIYLPRFKTKYLDDTPIIADVKDKLKGVIERAEHDVSAHLRRVKYSASFTQISLAQEYGIEVPPGHTFVRPHHRSGVKRETVFKSRSALGLLIEASRKSLAEVQEIIRETKEIHQEEIATAREEVKDWKNILNNFEEFELFVKDVINKMGIEAETTQKSYDGGIDIIANDNRGFAKLKYVFQCKFYDTSQTVGVDKIRELLGVKSADPTIDKAILVASCTFSPEATKFAEANGITLIDGENLFKMVSGLDTKPTS